jgi:TolB-like protein/DNA-binding winged helix-turn-helix (wHTH) protein/Tfp pilus assembly protein PilF
MIVNKLLISSYSRAGGRLLVIYLPPTSPVGLGRMGNFAPVTQSTSDQSLSNQRVRFGVFEADFHTGELRRNGLKIKLHAQPLAVLRVLLERPGEIVTREELQQKLWGNNTFVDFDHGLNKTINKLRDALSDDADTPRYIETLPRRGYRFIAPVTTPAPAAEPTPKPESKSRTHFALWAAAGVAVLIAFGIYWFGFWSRARHAAAVPTKAMLAVLPFENMSGNDSEDYFADGLTEEMIAQLGQLQPANLGVIARTSAMRYKHTKESVAQIGHELGVNYLLEGSVRLAGQRVRITAQLIQAGDQTHLWAESYETPLTDILNLQREIAQRITGSLRLELLPSQKSVATAAHFDPEAYRKYLLGLNESHKGTREAQGKAIQYFQQAIAIDPKDARPYAALAEAYSASVPYYMGPREAWPLIKQNAQKALEIDPNLAGAHVTMGDTALLMDWDWPAARAEYDRALAINPNLPEAHLGYEIYFATLGRHDEAIAHAQQAFRTDPLAFETRMWTLWVDYFSGRLQETVDEARRTSELEPQAALPYALLALADADLGRQDEAVRAAQDALRLGGDSGSVIATAASALAHAGQTNLARQALNQALELEKKQYVCRFLVGGVYLDLGETEQAYESLEKAFRQRSS